MFSCGQFYITGFIGLILKNDAKLGNLLDFSQKESVTLVSFSFLLKAYSVAELMVI